MTGNISDEEMGHITHVEAELNMFIDKRAKEAERNEEARKLDEAERAKRERRIYETRSANRAAWLAWHRERVALFTDMAEQHCRALDKLLGDAA